ncbi:MAG TPA: very short patch repair endonuclease [Verrucomicrobiae bacterium]|nr:very short patch repair endonuclease [Verrucomicrobiae bacterium]
MIRDDNRASVVTVLPIEMADVFSKRKRSQVMSSIRSSGNKATELAAIRIFRKQKIKGWRRQVLLPGKPDFVFRQQRVAVFIDGCFWHFCPRHGRCPASNESYWTAKLQRNRQRDRQVSGALRSKGWKVLRVWEHDLKHPALLGNRLRRAILEEQK